MSNSPVPITVLRFIGPDNAGSLGYDVAEYAAGRWVIEQGADRCLTAVDIPDSTDTDVAAAKRAAENQLGLTGGWLTMTAGWGPAYELINPRVELDTPDPGLPAITHRSPAYSAARETMYPDDNVSDLSEILNAAAPHIVAAELRHLADLGWVNAAHLRARADELDGGDTR